MAQIEMANVELTDSEIEAAVSVLCSGALRQGKQCAAFEEEFAVRVGSSYAITCSSGSAALHLAYMDCLSPGDDILVPSFTFIATASMAVLAGARPIFCDVDPDTFLIDLRDAETRITPKTTAIAPVHLFGNPCAILPIREFAAKYGLKIVWDAAQAHGAFINGQDVGSLGDFSCYSFYPSKNMFVGEGGMVCTDSEESALEINLLRNHGQIGKYYHTMIGANYRMIDVAAAIGREQLKRLDSMLTIRRRNASILTDGLKGMKGIRPQRITADSEHAWHQYCVIVDPEAFGCDRDALAVRLKQMNIATGVHYPRGLHEQPVFRKMYGKISLHNTEYLSKNILALPVHHGLTEDDAHRVVEAVGISRG
jgi:dTDP-4-amino-4,6-dideoxygalactose transaminase